MEELLEARLLQDHGIEGCVHACRGVSGRCFWLTVKLLLRWTFGPELYAKTSPPPG